MNNDNIPIIGAPKVFQVALELPAIFQVKLWFINHNSEYTTVDYALPPGIYPNPKWLEKLIDKSYRESLKALKLSTKNLSWRRCTPQEFVNATAGNITVKANPKWQPPYSIELEIEVPEAEVDAVIT